MMMMMMIAFSSMQYILFVAMAVTQLVSYAVEE